MRARYEYAREGDVRTLPAAVEKRVVQLKAGTLRCTTSGCGNRATSFCGDTAACESHRVRRGGLALVSPRTDDDDTRELIAKMQTATETAKAALRRLRRETR